MREALWPCGSHASEIVSYFAGTFDEPQAVLVAELESGKPIAVIELSMRKDLAETGSCLTGYVEGLYVVPEHRPLSLAAFSVPLCPAATLVPGDFCPTSVWLRRKKLTR